MTRRATGVAHSTSPPAHVSDATVVVVDDDRAVADLYSTWLDGEYTVETAYSGDEALEAVDQTVDVVSLDRHLSDRSGADVLATIRARDLGCAVAMVTAVEPDFDVVRMEFDDYLTKPVTEAELRETVRSLLARRQYDETVNELFSLVKKRAVLMDRKSATELKASDEYRELVGQIQAVNAELDGLVYGLSARDTEALFAQLDGRSRGGADD